MHTSSATFGYYPLSNDSTRLFEVYPSPRASEMSVYTFLRPQGGLTSTTGTGTGTGTGGTGLFPTRTFTQPNRPATSHVCLVQTPHLFSNLNELAVLVQNYDAYGDSVVSAAVITVTASLPGAPDMPLTTFSMRGAHGSQEIRRYSASVPASWFAAASTIGSIARVRTVLEGHDAHLANFTVYGMGGAFSSRLPSAGIAAFFSSDTAGAVPATTMRSGDTFYLQLYANTTGLDGIAYGLTSFEVKFVEDLDVCQLVAAAGSFVETYTGSVEGDTSGAYQTELLTRVQSPSDPTEYFTKYSRFQKLDPLASTHGHLGYVRMQMLGSGACLRSASITTFFHSGGTAYVPGVAPDDLVSVYGNGLNLYTDAPVGVIGQLVDAAPVVNTAFFTGVRLTVGIRVLQFSSPDSFTELSASVDVNSTQSSGRVHATVMTNEVSTSCSCSPYLEVMFTVVRPSAPVMRVDDDFLQALPSSCATYQATRVWAISDGADISRLVLFSSNDTTVVSVDADLPGHAIARGLSPGSTVLYVRDLAFASVAVTVTNSQVGVVRLLAGVVTSIEWAAVDSPEGPFLVAPTQRLSSEESVGWVYASAVFDDGSALPVETGVMVTATALLNASIDVAHKSSQPPRIDVRAGANSIADFLTVDTCLGRAFALVNLTLPPPTSIVITSNRYNVVPETNAASHFAGRYSYADLVASIGFADGSSRDMQVDPRVSFSIMGECATFSDNGVYKRMSIASTCRKESIVTTVVARVGGVEVEASQTFTVDWLASITTELFYQDGQTSFVSLFLRHRYACQSPVPT